MNAIVAGVGGSLGLFLGFSCLGVWNGLVDAALRRGTAEKKGRRTKKRTVAAGKHRH